MHALSAVVAEPSACMMDESSMAAMTFASSPPAAINTATGGCMPCLGPYCKDPTAETLLLGWQVKNLWLRCDANSIDALHGTATALACWCVVIRTRGQLVDDGRRSN